MMLKRFSARACACSALPLPRCGAAAASRAPQAAQPGAVGGRRTPTRPSICSGRSTCCPRIISGGPPKFDQAVGGSQQLVVETIVDDKNPTKLMAAMASLGFSPRPAAARRPGAAGKRAALAGGDRQERHSAPRRFDQMETWAAAFILLGNQFKDLGLKGDEGVEAVLRSDFTGQGKPIGELETNVEQLGFFDKLPENAQRDLLEGAIEDPAAMKQRVPAACSTPGRAATSTAIAATLQPRSGRLARASARR